MHWKSFAALPGTAEDLLKELAKRQLGSEVVELAPGESWPD